MDRATGPETVNAAGGPREGSDPRPPVGDGASKTEAPILKRDTRPTYDQCYLAGRIDERYGTNEVTIPGIQRLNTRYGVLVVQQAMRELHGFPPLVKVLKPYAYLEAMICGRLGETP
jgi:hypothetical protein